MNLRELSDSKLHESIQSLAKEERKLWLRLLRHLREVDRRKVFVEYGYETLFLYVRKELGYSDAEAQIRIESMRMLRDIAIGSDIADSQTAEAVIESALEEGRLNLTHLAQVRRASRRDRIPLEKSILLLEKVVGLSTRESAKAIARFCGQETPRRKLTFDLTDEQYELWMKARAELLHHGTSPEDIFQVLCELAVLNRNKVQEPSVKLAVEPEVNESLGKSVSLNTKVEFRKSRLRPINSSRRTVSVARRKRLIAEHCQFPGCRSRLGLQVDHKKPWSRGGRTTRENLQVLCVNHHARKSFIENG